MRAWRYPAQQALINRFGFNNPGADEARRRLERLWVRGAWPKHPIGINLGKSKVTPLEGAVEDYLYSLAQLHYFADYVAINVSSPNTPGLRSLQGVKPIKQLVAAVAKDLKRLKPKTPLFVKLAPDLAAKDLKASADACLGAGATGLILTNTTLSRAGLPAGEHPEGGLSGRPVQALADQALAAVAKQTKGRVPLIGVGGVFTRQDLLRKLELGAQLVQVYTGFIYQGPGMARELLM
jgi:dihydroorotate dehydrogenase